MVWCACVMREHYIHPDAATHGFAWLPSWPHRSIRSLNGMETDSTHTSHTPLQVNLRRGYIYIPTDIICENSSLKKFTVWQIRLNYLRAKTNRPLSKLHPPACMDWFYLDRVSIFHFFNFVSGMHCIAFMSSANLGTEKTQASIVELINSGVYYFNSVTPALIRGALPLNALQNWFIGLESFPFITSHDGNILINQAPAAGCVCFFFAVACKVSKSCKVQCTHLISWLSNGPIRTWFSSVPLQDKSISHKPQDI